MKVFRIGPVKVDPNNRCLSQRDQRIHVRPKTFDTLVLLLENPGRLLTKDELINKIWHQSFVTDEVLVHSIAEIRKALGDNVRNPRFIETVHKHGYIFIGQVEVVDGEARENRSSVGNIGESEAASAGWRNYRTIGAVLTGGALLALTVLMPLVLFETGKDMVTPSSQIAVFECGSVAIVPFKIQSDMPGDEWLSEGIAELIATGLSQSPDLKVTTTHEDDSAGGVALELAGEWLIRGSLVKSGQDIKITVSLVNLSDGRRAVSAQVSAKGSEGIINAVDRVLGILRRAIAKEDRFHHLAELTTESLDAYRHFIMALQTFFDGRLGSNDVGFELEKALSLDPSFPLAHVLLAEVTYRDWALGYSRVNSDEILIQATKYSDLLPQKERLLIEGLKALILEEDPERSLALWQRLERTYPSFAIKAGIPAMIAAVYQLRGDLAKLISYAEPLMENPDIKEVDKARISYWLSSAYRRKGDLDKAIRYAERSVSLSLLKDPPFFIHSLIKLGRNYLNLARKEEALRCFRLARDSSPTNAAHLTDAAWGFYMAEQVEDAFELVNQALRIDPDYDNAYHLRGWINLSTGNYLEAALDLESAYAKSPSRKGPVLYGKAQGDLAALYYAGVAYTKLGEHRKAKAIFERVVAMLRSASQATREEDRTSPIFTETDPLVILAYLRLGRRLSAGELMQQIAFNRDSSVGFYKQLARLYAVHGDEEIALDWLQKAVAAGEREYRHIRDNPDFEKLRELPGFQRLVGAVQ